MTLTTMRCGRFRHWKHTARPRMREVGDCTEVLFQPSFFGKGTSSEYDIDIRKNLHVNVEFHSICTLVSW